MNFLNEFESRIGAVFGDAPQGYTEPFSFKKLAKKAAREMEAETYEVQGVEMAPALYTMLVSPADDSLMRPLYNQITEEMAMYIAAEVEKRGYSLVGAPLVRFMIDPSLRSGRFAIFAENVDYRALERLRAEEQAFMGGNSSLGGAASANAGAVAPKPVLDDDDLSPFSPAPASAAPANDSIGSIAAQVPTIDDGLDAVPFDYPEPISVDADDSFVAPVPATQRKPMPLVDSRPAVNAPLDIDRPASCVLVDRTTGRSHTAAAPSATIGRERAAADIVLSDPNVSRRHAQLSFDGAKWHIHDLGSTNGTRVNDIDIDECILSDGDIITCGLVSLEFREI